VIDNNPAEAIQAPLPDTPEMKTVWQEEVNQLLATTEGWVYDLIYIALFTGMRRGELLALRWNDVDFNQQIIRVRQSITKVTGKDLKFRLHDLRHTHATLMLQADIHPKIVQERLGHSSINQTLDTYSHVIPSMQKEAVKKLKNTLNK